MQETPGAAGLVHWRTQERSTSAELRHAFHSRLLLTHDERREQRDEKQQFEETDRGPDRAASDHNRSTSRVGALIDGDRRESGGAVGITVHRHLSPDEPRA